MCILFNSRRYEFKLSTYFIENVTHAHRYNEKQNISYSSHTYLLRLDLYNTRNISSTNDDKKKNDQYLLKLIEEPQ